MVFLTLVCVLSCSAVSDSFVTPVDCSHPGNFPGKKTGAVAISFSSGSLLRAKLHERQVLALQIL